MTHLCNYRISGGLAWRTNRLHNVEQEAVIAISHLYTPLMSSKRKGRSSAASQSSNQSPEEKRSKYSETDEVFEALEMAEDIGLKLQRVLNKLEKLDKIEAHLSEVSASLASIEEKVSRLDEDVQNLKQETNRVEKKASELEESIQFNEEDISDLKKESKESKFEINDLRKQLLYLETYSSRKNVKFFGIDKVASASEVDSPPEDTRNLLLKFLENKLRIENPHGRIEFQRVHRLGKPNNSSDKPCPIIARFLRYSDKEMMMDQARKELKRQQDKQFSVFDDIPKELYEIRKSQMKKFKEARSKGCTVYFSKAQPAKLFVNGKFILANAPLSDFV